jgi:Cu/Ag efflux protein CusF
MKIGIQIAVLLGISFAAPVFAQKSPDDHSDHHTGAQEQSAGLTEGEVRKVDKDAKKLTIKHGPIVNLDMPAMTMVFQVKDPAMLGRVKAGDKVKFHVENLGGTYTVTSIEAVN